METVTEIFFYYHFTLSSGEDISHFQKSDIICNDKADHFVIAASQSPYLVLEIPLSALRTPVVFRLPLFSFLNDSLHSFDFSP